MPGLLQWSWDILPTFGYFCMAKFRQMHHSLGMDFFDVLFKFGGYSLAFLQFVLGRNLSTFRVAIGLPSTYAKGLFCSVKQRFRELPNVSFNSPNKPLGFHHHKNKG